MLSLFPSHSQRSITPYVLTAAIDIDILVIITTKTFAVWSRSERSEIG